MKSGFALLPGSLLLVTLCACGGKEPEPATAVTAPPPPREVVDLSPVKTPATLFAWARVSEAEKMLSTAFGYAGLPSPGASVLAELAELREVGAVVDPQQPLEVAAFLTERGSPRGLVSVPLRSLEDAKSKLAPFKVSDENGVLTVRFTNPNDEESEESFSAASAKLCQVAAAVGSQAGVAGAPRMVCGRQDALESYASFMTRTLPTLPAKSPLYGEVHLRALRPHAREAAKMTQALKVLVDIPELNGLLDLVSVAADDAAQMLNDLESVLVQGDLTDDGFKLTVDHRFGSANSSLAKMMVSHPERAAAPPAGFDQIPAHAGMVAYQQGIDWAPFDSGYGQLMSRLTELAKQVKFPEADRAKLEDVINRSKALVSKPTSAASGVDLDAALSAITAYNNVSSKNSGTQETAAVRTARLAVLDALRGWRVNHISNTPDEFVALYKDTVGAVSSAAVRKWIGSEGSKLLGAKPAATSQAKINELLNLKVKVSKAKATLGLPAGTQQLEVTMPRFDELKRVDAGGKLPTATEYTLVAADGTGAVVASAPSAQLAATKLKDALAKAGASDAGVRKLAQSKGNGALFLSPRALIAMMLRENVRGSVRERDIKRLRTASEDGGFFSWRAQAPSADAKGGSLQLEFELPKQSIISLVPLVRQF